MRTPVSKMFRWRTYNSHVIFYMHLVDPDTDIWRNCSLRTCFNCNILYVSITYWVCVFYSGIHFYFSTGNFWGWNTFSRNLDVQVEVWLRWGHLIGLIMYLVDHVIKLIHSMSLLHHIKTNKSSKLNMNIYVSPLCSICIHVVVIYWPDANLYLIMI